MLERRLAETERKANTLLEALNELRAEAGLPPRPPGHGGGGSGPSASVSTQIKPDTFFGKKQQTAIREYLEMRRAQGLGPAKPREIYDALVAGGFRYDAKDAETALVGMRAMLRKRTATFIKVGNGAYGLTSWYPDAKKPKPASPVAGSSDDDTDDDSDTETAASPDEESDDAAVA